MKKVTNITIEWAEGTHTYADQFPKTFNSFSAINTFFFTNAKEYPKGGGYDKHKILVQWEDGETYEYRADMQAPTDFYSQLEYNVGARIMQGLKNLVERNVVTNEDYQIFISERQFV